MESITNALGHLYGIGFPNDYGYTEKRSDWTIEELPLKPQEYKFVPTTSPDNNYAATLNNTRKMITTLMKQDDVNEVICATDAVREGNLYCKNSQLTLVQTVNLYPMI
ncbi:MAG: hypothetical protein FWG90_01950 [Oscillospiraceae bacterium]|nr:hypothetical protein [Oscillospiraceae bacterium]